MTSPQGKLERFLQILLIEDNPADVRLVTLALAGLVAQYKLKVVGNGREALDFLKKRDHYFDALRPDFIFLDLHLPIIDGKEVLREIKKDPELENIPVVVVTGETFEQSYSEVNSLRANFFIPKPVTLDRFSIAIKYLEEVLGVRMFPKES